MSPAMYRRIHREQVLRNLKCDVRWAVRQVRFYLFSPRLVWVVIRARLHYRYGIGPEPVYVFRIYP